MGELAVRGERGVAFEYNGTQVLFDEGRLVSLTQMWEAAGRPVNQDPPQWVRYAGSGFIADLIENLNMGKAHVIKTRRGKGVAGTWAHWQAAMAYAKYLSHEFHRFVNEAFREWVEEKADPGLKAERAIAAYQKKDKDLEWIGRRFSGIANRKLLTSTMADHNCKVRGKNDNPFAEATRSISLSVIGKTPKEIKAGKGLAKTAKTRDHLELDELISIEWAEIQARKLMAKEGSDGNSECVDCCKRAGKAVRLALDSLQSA